MRSDTVNTRQNAFNLVSDIALSDAFSLGFDVDYGRISADQSNLHFDLTRLQLEPTLHLSNGVYVGAYLQRATTAIPIFSVSLDSAGAFAGYDAGTWAVEGYVGNTTLDVNIGNNSVQSLRNTGLTVTVRPIENLELFAHVAQSRGDDQILFGVGNVDLRSVGGQYDMNNGITLYAATQSLGMGDSSMPLRQNAIGAGFDLSRLNDKLPGTVTLELARNSVEGGSDQTITTIGWVMPIGKGKATPLSSIARTARGGIRGAFVAGAGSMSLLSSLANIPG
jgi:hypothetical protein